MLATLARRIGGAASWRRVRLLMVAYVALFTTMTACEVRIKVHSGGLGVPDLLQGFTAAELYARLEAFGPAGRRLYFFAELLDLVYPFVYATLFAFVMALAARALFAAGSRWALACVLPYAVMIFDYLEDACFFTVLFAWPARLEAVATVGGVFNLGKWLLLAVVAPLAVLGLGGMGIQAVRRRGARAG
jgi:hypothetical protein